ncbi:MAG: hypothetical protein KUL82_09595 [Bdellovibrio sp.]|nr:hypothetical protein [Bdellovibrio sp.]
MTKSIVKVFAVCSATISLVACSSGGGGSSASGGSSANTLTPAVTGPVSGAGLLSLGVKPMSAGISIKGGTWPTGGSASSYGEQFFSAVTGFYIAGAAADLFSCYAKALSNNATTVSGFDDGSDHYALGFDDISRYKFKVTKGADGSVSTLTATVCENSTTPTLTLSYDGATNTTKVRFGSYVDAIITGTYSGGAWLNKTVNFTVGSSTIRMTQASSAIDILGFSGIGMLPTADFYGKTTISGTSYSTYKMGEGSMTNGTATASWGADGLNASSSAHQAAVDAYDLNYTPSADTGLTHWNCTDGWDPVYLANASNAFKMEALACETSFAK